MVKLESIVNKISNKSRSLYNSAKLGAAAVLISAGLNAQTGSGTITANTADNQTTAINIQGTSTFDSGEYQFNLPGTLGTPIDFTEWPIASLSTNDYDFTDEVIFGRTSKELNAYFRLENPQDIQAQLYNIQGQNIGPITSRQGPNGLTQLFYDGSKLADGIYIAQVQAGNQQGAFKVALVGDAGDGQPNPFPQNNSLNRLSKSESIMSRNSMSTNYSIEITGDDINTYTEDVEVLEGNNNNFEFTVVPRNGDVGIKPRINGIQTSKAIVTMENQADPSKTYSVNMDVENTTTALFPNIFVSSPDSPDTYNVNIVSTDGSFIETNITTDIFQDINYEINLVKNFEVNTIPNEQR
jgi:hypothetical protein